MDKLLSYSSEDANNKYLYTLRMAGGPLTKLAAASEWPPEVTDFINKLVPKEHCHYSLCNALGAGEYWSSNVNGDFFEQDELIEHHPSFLSGTPFMHHINKDPSKGYGKIHFSAYNPRMNRVELVVEYDTTKLPKDIVSKLEKDELVSLSMGCRVPYDVCSICGNKALTPKDYCEHVTKNGLNYVYPDGRKVFVYNPDPDFFDISIVVVPADKTACILAKIFGATKVAKISDPLRGFRDLVIPSSVKAAMVKEAAEKESELAPPDTLKNLSFKEIVKIAADTKTAKGLADSIKVSNAYFKPNEIQAILFSQLGLTKIAKVLLENNAYIEAARNVITDLGPDGKAVKLAGLTPNARAILAANNVSPEVLQSISLEEDVNSVFGITPEMLDEIARVAMLSGTVGAAMSGGSMNLAALGMGSSVAARYLRSAPSGESEILHQIRQNRDLNIAPLIRSKRASVDLTLREIYSIPFMCR